ncbi:MAG: MFS transporter, partial [Chloroflexi bacterium]|nr:MFS transporter [Chloroflexota bacterium]
MAATEHAPAEAAAAAGPARRPRVYYGYYIVGIAFLAQLISAGSQTYVAGVFLTPMTEDLDWSRTEFTSAQTVGRFAMVFIAMLVGGWVDRGYARRLLFIGGTFLVGALFATSYVSTLWEWMLVRGLLTAVGATLIGNLVVNVTLSKWFVERRGRMVGIAAMGVSFAGVVLPLILTPVVDELGWRAGWRVLALIAALTIYPIAFFIRSTPEQYGLHPDGKSDEEMATAAGDRARADFDNSLTRRQALRTVALYQIVVAFGISGIGLGTVLFTAIPFTTDAGFSRATGAFMLAFAVALPAALCKPLWGSLTDRCSPKLLSAASFVVAAVGMVTIVIAAQAQAVYPLAFGFVLVGTGFGGQIPLQEVIWAAYFGRRYLGSVRSVAMPFALLFSAGGPLLVQVYFDLVGDYNGAFLAVGAA